MKTYLEKLKDPRWQRKRLEIMQKYDFSCQRCQSKEKTLEIHYGYYRSGNKPWEYSSDELFCLCDDCHELFHTALNCAKALMGKMSFEQLSFLIWILMAWNNKYSYTDMQSATLGFAGLMGQWTHHGELLDLLTQWWHESYGPTSEASNG